MFIWNPRSELELVLWALVSLQSTLRFPIRHFPEFWGCWLEWDTFQKEFCDSLHKHSFLHRGSETDQEERKRTSHAHQKIRHWTHLNSFHWVHHPALWLYFCSAASWSESAFTRSTVSGLKRPKGQASASAMASRERHCQQLTIGSPYQESTCWPTPFPEWLFSVLCCSVSSTRHNFWLVTPEPSDTWEDPTHFLLMTKLNGSNSIILVTRSINWRKETLLSWHKT